MLSDIGCDPFTRRVIRVSMGSVFSLPIARSPNLANDLTQLRDAHNFRLLAAVSDQAATPIDRMPRPTTGTAVLFGNEPEGLGEPWLSLCDDRITIPMRDNVDSLNLAIAAGIVMHRLTASDTR